MSSRGLPRAFSGLPYGSPLFRLCASQRHCRPSSRLARRTPMQSASWFLVALTLVLPASGVSAQTLEPKLPPMPSMEGPPSTGEMAKPANAPRAAPLKPASPAPSPKPPIAKSPERDAPNTAAGARPAAKQPSKPAHAEPSKAKPGSKATPKKTPPAHSTAPKPAPAKSKPGKRPAGKH